jgi:hypothetical protein
VTRWHVNLQEYDYKIQYIPGKENAPPDALSWQLGANKGQDDNQGVVVVPAEKFKIATLATSHITPKGKVRVPPLDEVKQGIMQLVHDHPSTGHPE